MSFYRQANLDLYRQQLMRLTSRNREKTTEIGQQKGIEDETRLTAQAVEPNNCRQRCVNNDFSSIAVVTCVESWRNMDADRFTCQP
ncbi:hypothetical protein EVAR_3290_1 [Eumeta japonica]|uniref:Uncharacterized protein n=1 Tax=Eumeta variegata TaxID=151549 RepID=A0A4C1SV46_EUMVA|nr:hypothetical protein EVAR_3290_1 [Eumeta japonica]